MIQFNYKSEWIKVTVKNLYEYKLGKNKEQKIHESNRL